MMRRRHRTVGHQVERLERRVQRLEWQQGLSAHYFERRLGDLDRDRSYRIGVAQHQSGRRQERLGSATFVVTVVLLVLSIIATFLVGQHP